MGSMVLMRKEGGIMSGDLKEKGMDRREFLKVAAAGAVACSVWPGFGTGTKAVAGSIKKIDGSSSNSCPKNRTS